MLVSRSRGTYSQYLSRPPGISASHRSSQFSEDIERQTIELSCQSTFYSSSLLLTTWSVGFSLALAGSRKKPVEFVLRKCTFFMIFLPQDFWGWWRQIWWLWNPSNLPTHTHLTWMLPVEEKKKKEMPIDVVGAEESSEKCYRSLRLHGQTCSG